jgi:hypothetical protein
MLPKLSSISKNSSYFQFRSPFLPIHNGHLTHPDHIRQIPLEKLSLQSQFSDAFTWSFVRVKGKSEGNY